MAKKKTTGRSSRESGTRDSVLEKLDGAEAASVLKSLLDRHPELRPEAETLAKGVLGEVSLFSVADDVESAILQLDYDDLNGRAGGHSWGYVEPAEAAEELLEEAVEPFVAEIQRHLEMGLEEQAQAVCQGILLGLYRVRDSDSNDILNWAPDFPGEAAAYALDVWNKTAGTEQGAPARKKQRRLSRDFVREHIPDWDWVLNPGAGA